MLCFKHSHYIHILCNCKCIYNFHFPRTDFWTVSIRACLLEVPKNKYHEYKLLVITTQNQMLLYSYPYPDNTGIGYLTMLTSRYTSSVTAIQSCVPPFSVPYPYHFIPWMVAGSGDSLVYTLDSSLSYKQKVPIISDWHLSFCSDLLQRTRRLWCLVRAFEILIS